jgi:hypothetical protein
VFSPLQCLHRELACVLVDQTSTSLFSELFGVSIVIVDFI